MINVKKLRVAQIGVGHDHAAGVMECVLAHSDLFEILGIVEEDDKLKSLLNSTAVYSGIPIISLEELLLLKPDAVFVECCEKDLVHYAQICIDNGINVHMDKPGGINVQDFEVLLYSAQKKKLFVNLGYMYRTNPAVLKARAIVESGALGKIYAVHSVMNADHEKDKREWLNNFKGGIMYFLGCHLIDLTLSFIGNPDSTVVFHRKSGIGGVSAVDNSLVVFDYGNAVSTVEVTSVEFNPAFRRQFVICGENGTLEIKPLEWPTELFVTTRNGVADEHTVFEPYGRYDKMIESFYLVVIGEIKPEFDYEYELNLQKLLMEICNN